MHNNLTTRLYNATGAALLTALFIVALVAGIAALMAVRQQITFRLAELMLTSDQLYLYAQGGQDWASEQLLQRPKSPSGVVDVFPDLKPQAFRGATVAGHIQDQQGLFNINSLANANNLAGFIRLLRTVAPALTPAQANTIALNINQWLTPHNNADEIYSKRQPPYRAAHHLMASISELRLVEGVDAQLFRRLVPYLTALPTTQNVINVSTVPPPVLLTLAPLSLEQAVNITRCRQSNGGFVSLEDFNNCLKSLHITQETSQQLTVQSNYFLASTRVTIGKQQLTLYSLLYRVLDQQTNQPSVAVLWQSRDSI